MPVGTAVTNRTIGFGSQSFFPSGIDEFQALVVQQRLDNNPRTIAIVVNGPIAAKLWLSSATEDADLFLVFRMFTPDLREVVFMGAIDPHTPVAQGWLRASHRDRIRLQVQTGWRIILVEGFDAPARGDGGMIERPIDLPDGPDRAESLSLCDRCTAMKSVTAMPPMQSSPASPSEGSKVRRRAASIPASVFSGACPRHAACDVTSGSLTARHPDD